VCRSTAADQAKSLEQDKTRCSSRSIPRKVFHQRYRSGDGRPDTEIKAITEAARQWMSRIIYAGGQKRLGTVAKVMGSVRRGLQALALVTEVEQDPRR